MSKFDKDELYLIIDFLEEMKEGCGYKEDETMYDLTIEVIQQLIKE